MVLSEITPVFEIPNLITSGGLPAEIEMQIDALSKGQEEGEEGEAEEGGGIARRRCGIWLTIGDAESDASGNQFCSIGAVIDDDV